MNRDLQYQTAEGATVAEKLRHSEASARLLIEGVRDYAIYLLDPNGFVTTWNSGAERIKGYRAEEIIGKHFSCFYTPADVRAGVPQQALQVAATDGQYEAESLRVRKDGSVFWANVLITALNDGAGNLYGFGKVVRDITERKKAEERLREQERLATLGTTAAVIAHEIGNALNGLSTSLQVATEIIEGSNHEPALTETLAIAQQEVQRLAALLKDYRSFAKPQHLKREPTRLRQLVEEVLAPAMNGYRAANIAIKLDLPESAPEIAIDREKIKQVILNLCKNAAEAMPEGGTLTCRAYVADGSVALEIADTGSGIAEGLDVFQLFKTTKPYGTGLGLPIVQQIVSEHHGSVEYVSEIGKGTTFTVTLPLSSNHVPPVKQPAQD